MPVPPGLMSIVVIWLPALGFALAVVPALIIVWRRRKDLPSADVALVAGGAMTVLAMTGPWFSMDKAIRFYLIALLPTIIVGMFSVQYIATAWRRRSVLGLLLLVGIGGTVMMLPRGGQPVLSDAAMSELRGLARYIHEPDRTLIVTQHGAEWWTAWFLRTRVAQPEALQPDDWKRYDTILILEMKSGMEGNMPGGGGPPQPKMFAPIPPDAEVLYDGATMKLARFAAPPDSVFSRRSTLVR